MKYIAMIIILIIKSIDLNFRARFFIRCRRLLFFKRFSSFFLNNS